MEPIVGASPKVLILGAVSKERYYASPSDRFWVYLGEALRKDLALLTYEARLEFLKEKGIALWDVMRDEEPNAVARLARETGVKTVFLNGGRAEAAYKTFVAESMPSGISAVRLPSSSPADRSFTDAEKVEAWRVVAQAL